MAERSYDEESLKRLSSHKILTREEEQSLLERISRGDAGAVKDLVEHNQRFVINRARRLANQYGRKDLVMDLYSAGTMQLVKAARGYNIEKSKEANNGTPVKFSTYAYRIVGVKMRRELFKLVKSFIPKDQEKYVTYRAVLKSLRNEGIPPELGVLEERLKFSREKILSFIEFDQRKQFSLHAPTNPRDKRGNEGSDVEFIELLGQRDKQIDFLEVEKLRKVLKSLNPSYRRVLELRYLSEKPRTLGGVAEELGITKEGVRQIELKALEKLKFRMSRPIEGLNLSLSKISKKRRAYRTWKDIDLQEYYRQNYSGMNKMELYKQDQSFYVQLRKRGILNEVVGREETNQSSG